MDFSTEENTFNMLCAFFIVNPKKPKNKRKTDIQHKMLMFMYLCQHRRLLLTCRHIAEVAASQHFINASNGAKIHKYLSREVRQQFWQYAR
jgi:hypothetical protein